MTGRKTDDPESYRKVVNLTVVACIGAQYSVSLHFFVKDSAVYQDGTAEKGCGQLIPCCWSDCDPQPANYLISHYVLRHCCISALSGKR
ncbi:hypothetical protein DBV23_15245 [Edwardsiella ictaluri]|nr:hypothetical protein DBV23_15245 [Edwardsiella ictaluri]